MKSRDIFLTTKFSTRIVLVLLLCVGWTVAQSSLDKGTPAESKPGTSTPSTYAPDKLETVNLGNGNLSMNLPLVSIGGRGSAAFTLGLSYNSKVWSTQHEKEDTGVDPAGTPLPYLHHYYARYDQGSMESPNRMPLGGGWSISLGPALKVRKVNIGPHKCSNNRNTCYEWILTKLSLVLPDGAEVELRDQFTQGAPHWVGSAPPDGSDRFRGRVWLAGDGSATTYVSDVDNGVVNNQLSGWVFLADGTRIRMEGDTWGMSARFTKIIDRNGNFIVVDYANAAGIAYTDELGRQVILNWAAPAPATITIKGYSGVPDRVISIDVQPIGALDGAGVASNLRSDFRSLPRPFTSGDYLRTAQGDWDHTIIGPHTDLFLGSESGDNVDEHYAITRVDLLDGRSLRFRYNQFGEVAEVTYPGGGVSQIDYQRFQTSMCEGIAPYTDTLDRRVTQRRLLTDGTNIDATWTYSIDTVGKTGTVQVHQGDQNGLLLSSETHYFLALKAEYKVCRFVQQTADVMADGTHYERWDNAKEYRVEKQTGSGTEVTIRQWEQRTPVVYLSEPNAVYTQEQPANDPRVVWEETTIDNGRKKRTEYTYDDFNNVTLIKEYDFGGTDGGTGLLMRQTLRNYATSLNGYCYSNLNPLDSTCGTTVTTNPNSIIHQRRNLLSETIKDAVGNQKAYTEFEYDNYVADQNHAVVALNPGMIQYDATQFIPFTTANQPRGNITRIKRWAGGSDYIYSFSKYDEAGNTVWSKDPRGNVTTASFADNFGNGGNPDTGSPGTNGLTYALATLISNPLGHQVRGQFDYTRGVQTGVKNANGVIAKTEYDLIGRPTRQTAAVDLAEQAITEISYPTATSNFSTTSKQLDATRWLSTKIVGDGFGRVRTALTAEDGQHANSASFSIRIDTEYDGLGRVKRTSNPYRPEALETAAYTVSAYDLAGRVISVTTPDGAVVTTSYAGNTVTVSDQANKQRKSVTDALGRLREVYEAPNDPGFNYFTSYEYDVLDNLVKVTQDTQQRFFMYDPLKRLIRARNPEQGTHSSLSLTDPVTGNSTWSIGYQYDANGNLTQKTDARGVVSTYVYDALNRNTTIDYSDTATNPDVSRFYDGATNGKGALWYSYAGGDQTLGSNVEKTLFSSYDSLGRPLQRQQSFKLNGVWSAPFLMSRSYNLAGGVSSQVYPSGHSVTYNYDGAGRLADKDAQNLAFTGNLGDGVSRTYSRGISYASAGQLKQEQFGTTTPVYNKLFYNSRLQLAEIRTGTSGNDWNRGKILNDYSLQCSGAGCNATDNNGNLRRQQLYIPGDEQVSSWTTWYQQYDYDSLNRLKRVHEYTGNTLLDWQQEYDYDRWGNRTLNATNTWLGNAGNPPNPALNETQFETGNLAATNRLYAPGDLALPDNQRRMRYDAAGNLSVDTYTGAGERVYDAENRMTQAWANNQWQYYTYNAEGQRTRRKINNQETSQVYGFDGELLAEYAANGAAASPQKEYGYRNGQLLVTAEPVATQNVSWTNVVGVSLAGNSLTKTASTGWGNAGASSSQSIVAGDGYVELTASEITTARIFGLSHADTNQNWTAVDFALDLDSSGVIYIFEAGNNRGTFGNYAPGDKLRVAVESGVVQYRKNGTLLYTSAVAPTYPLLVDTALYSNAATLSNVVINGNSPNVGWTNTAGVSTSGNSLTKTAPTGWGNAGAASLQTMAAGDGYVEVTATETSLARLFGLSDTDPDQNWTSIDFAIDLDLSGTIYIFESGNNRGTFGTYSTGDKLRVAIEGGVVKYKKNGTLLYTSSVTPAYPLRVDTALYSNNATLSNVVLVSGTSAPPSQVQWLVSDHLGTPRMIIDQTGSLVTVKRHDYLPFGEELFTPGLRTSSLGYAADDSVRQQFTAKERDIETGLDYFLARYYSSSQGRFTSPDPFSIIQMRQSARNDAKTHSAFMQFIGDPRRWNRFAYAINSPLVFTDKTGLDIMIIENGPTKGNPIGHTAIAVTGRGVFSMGNGETTTRYDHKDKKNNIIGGGVADYLNRESPRRDTTIFVVKTTPEQDAAIVSSMVEQAQSKRDISQDKKSLLLVDNCSTRVNEALDKAGGELVLPIDPPLAVQPGSAGARAMLSGLPVTVISIPQGTNVSNLKDTEKKIIENFEPPDRPMKKPDE